MPGLIRGAHPTAQISAVKGSESFTHNPRFKRREYDITPNWLADKLVHFYSHSLFAGDKPLVGSPPPLAPILISFPRSTCADEKPMWNFSSFKRVRGFQRPT